MNIELEDLDDLRHMLGADSKTPGFRNYYAAEPNHEGMARLMAAGLVKRGRVIPGELVYFHATEHGCKAVGLTRKAIERALSK